MKTTSSFKDTIQEHLNFRAFTDELFAETLKKPNKSIDECIQYILKTVKDSGSNGFEDKEIFGMAIHYYDEDDVVGPKVPINQSKVVVNHHVKLTPQEIKDAKQKAINEVIQEEKDKMRKKPAKTVKAKPEETNQTNSLF